MAPTTLLTLSMDVNDLHPWPRNYNRHDTEKQLPYLSSSLTEFGQFKNIVVAQRDGRYFIVAGHGLVEAAKQVGIETLEAKVLPPDWTDEKIEALLVADNRIAQLADPDRQLLAEILDSIRVTDESLLGSVGYTSVEIDTLLRQAEQQLPSDTEWNAAFDRLPEEDRAPFQQMTFTLHDSQAEQVKRAISIASKVGDFADSPNQNGNGNALSLICETFITNHDNS